MDFSEHGEVGDILLAVVTVLPAGLAMSKGRAAAEASSLKVDFSGCFCFSFSVALFCRTLVLAVSGLVSLAEAGGGVAGAVPAGEAPEPGVSVFSLARRSALRFFHSASLAARSASLSLACVSGSFFLSSRGAASDRSRLLSGAGVADDLEPGRREAERRRLSLSSSRLL